MLIATKSTSRASGNRPSTSRRRQIPLLPVLGSTRRSSAKWNSTSPLRCAQDRTWHDQTTRMILARAFARSAIFNLRSVFLQSLRDTEHRPQAEYLGLGLLNLLSTVGHATHDSALVQLLDQGLAPVRELLREHLVALLMERTKGMVPPRAMDVWLNTAKELVIAETASRVSANGLDPAKGYLHTGSQSLAHDLALPLCPCLVEGALYQPLQSMQIEEADFELQGSTCLLSKSGRQKLLLAMASQWRASSSLNKSISLLMDEQQRALVQFLVGETDVFAGCLLATV
jgi:CRISPR/Cas system-associated endonuclease Cas1